MKRFLVGIMAFVMIASTAIVAYAKEFSDVPETFWGYSAVHRWVEEGVVDGYPDGQFKPNSIVKRAELIKLVVEIVDPDMERAANCFTDVSGDSWYFEYVEKGIALGILDTSYRTLNPNEELSREEACVILNRLLKIKAEDNEELLELYTDESKISSGAKSAVQAFIEKGFLKGYTDGSIQPRDIITRAEMLTLLDRIVAEIITDAGVYDLADVIGFVVIRPTVKGDVVLKGTQNISGIIASDKASLGSVTVSKDAENAKEVEALVKEATIVEEITDENIKEFGASTATTTKTDTTKTDNKEDKKTTTTKKSSGGGGGGSSSSTSLATITINSDGDIYKITKSGARIANGNKITVVVNYETVLSNVSITESTLDENIKKVVEKLELGRVFKTLDTTYSSNASARKLGIATFDSLSTDQKAVAILAAIGGDNDAKFYDVYKVLTDAEVVTDATLKEKAYAAMNTVFTTYLDKLAALNEM